MSVKNKDPKGHWRCKTVSFRLSSQEAHRLDVQVSISGMFKQDYIVKRLMNEEITIHPNTRVQRRIIEHLDALTAELQRLEQIDQDSDVLDNIRYLLELTVKLTEQQER